MFHEQLREDTGANIRVELRSIRYCGSAIVMTHSRTPNACSRAGSRNTSAKIRVASQQIGPHDFRSGSKADMTGRICNFRFTPKSGHCGASVECPLSGKSRQSAPQQNRGLFEPRRSYSGTPAARSASNKGVASEGGIANAAQSPLVLKFGRSLSRRAAATLASSIRPSWQSAAARRACEVLSSGL